MPSVDETRLAVARDLLGNEKIVAWRKVAITVVATCLDVPKRFGGAQEMHLLSGGRFGWDAVAVELNRRTPSSRDPDLRAEQGLLARADGWLVFGTSEPLLETGRALAENLDQRRRSEVDTGGDVLWPVWHTPPLRGRSTPVPAVPVAPTALGRIATLLVECGAGAALQNVELLADKRLKDLLNGDQVEQLPLVTAGPPADVRRVLEAGLLALSAALDDRDEAIGHQVDSLRQRIGEDLRPLYRQTMPAPPAELPPEVARRLRGMLLKQVAHEPYLASLPLPNRLLLAGWMLQHLGADEPLAESEAQNGRDETLYVRMQQHWTRLRRNS